MILNWLLSALHILALILAFPALLRRSQALLGALNKESLQRAISGDTLWGLAVGLWLVSGVVRILRSDVGIAGYASDPLFLVKMGLFALMLVLELLPMFTFMRWRAMLGNDRVPGFKFATPIARISQVQMVMVVLILALALANAFGIGFGV